MSAILRRLVKFVSLLALLIPVAAAAQNDALQGHCTLGGKQALVSGLSSTNYDQGIVPGCSVTVYFTGTTTKATIYSDVTGTPLTNPFTAVQLPSPNAGYWIFYAPDGQGYDVKLSGGGGNPSCTTAPNCYTTPLTYTDLKVGSGGGGGQTIVQFNGVPSSPASPVNFIDTSSCTWNLTGNVAGVSCTGGGSGTIPAWPIMFYPLTQTIANQIFVGHPSGNSAITVPNGCSGSAARTYATATGGSAPVATGSVAWTFQDFTTSTTLCTFTWSASGSVAAVTGAGGTINSGDSIGFVGAATADATLANVGAIVAGTVSGGGGGGSSIALQTNGVLNSSQTLLNFVNAPNFNGLGINFSNSSGGIETLSITGTLNNAGLTNSTMTINGVTCTLGATCTISGGGGSPGGTNGQTQFNNAGAFGGYTMNGDATINTATGAITVTKTNGVAFGTFATQNFATPPPIGAGAPNTGAFSSLTIGSLNGCLTATAGAISAAGSCGASPLWNTIGNPAADQALSMTTHLTGWTWGAATGASDLFSLTDTASNTGTGIMLHPHTQSGSTEIPFQADANGVGWKIGTDGSLTGVGSAQAGTLNFGQGTAPGSLPTHTVQIYGASSIVTSYALIPPSSAPTSSNGRLDCSGTSTPFTCTWQPPTTSAATVASAEVVAFSATPTFSSSFNVSRIVLTGNITSFTMGGSPADGQDKTLCFKQGAGPYTVAPPAAVHGFFTVGTINGDWNCQTLVFDNTDSIWTATTVGVINE